MLFDIQAMLGALGSGALGLVGFAYNKHSTRMKEIESVLDTKLNENDVNKIMKPMEVKLDLIHDDLREIKDELMKIRKY